MSYVTLQSALALLNNLYQKEQNEKRTGSAPKAQVYQCARKELYSALQKKGYKNRTDVVNYYLQKWRKKETTNAFVEQTRLKKAAWQEVLAMADGQLVYVTYGTENDLIVEWRGEKGIKYQAYHTKERKWVEYASN